jgi:hypothetical protein
MRKKRAATGTEFVRSDGKFNTFRFKCDFCQAHGTINIPVTGDHPLFSHGCESGTILIQRTPRVGCPYLEEIALQEVAHA